MDTNRRSFLHRTHFQGAVVAVAVCAGMTAANALTAGRTGGHSRSALTVSGTINGPGMGASVTVNYDFLKGGSTVCTVPTTLARDTSTGSFTGEVDTAACPSNLFDGSDVTVRVDVGDAGVATGAVNPVPYARYAEQVGTADCPVGYERDRAETRWVVCSRAYALGAVTVRDEVVRVGTGATAFWMDRYEASVWDATSGAQFGATGADYPSRLGANGQWAAGARDSLLALSRAGVTPSRFLSWFQASAVCSAAGKRLMTRREWFAATDGLVAIDPTAPLNGNATGEHGCNTGGSGPRNTGLGTDCVSSWGVQDLIGNLWEQTEDWYAAAGTANGTNNAINIDALSWPSGYGEDATQNVNGSVVREVPTRAIGLPGVGLLGGQWSSGTTSGVFSLDVGAAPRTARSRLASVA
ncbi:MAG: SUMF1/EgtB/PvdO family nonheme iron enzyme [Polyangiales bacterium]